MRDDMERKLRLKKLLHSGQITTLLKDFALLLGAEVPLAVSDGPGHLLGSHQHFPPEVAHALWQAVPARRPPTAGQVAEVVITPQGAAVPIYVEAQRVGLILAAGSLPPPAQTQTHRTPERDPWQSAVAVRFRRCLLSGRQKVPAWDSRLPP